MAQREPDIPHIVLLADTAAGNLLMQNLDQLKKKLDPQAYDVVVNKATEIPGTGKYLNHNESGVYQCIVCGQELFSSDTKYDSGTGWPSFDNPVNLEHIELQQDNSHGMQRTEVVCKNCGAHLGHLFEDPRTKSGKDYCINSCALNFKSKQ